MAAAPIAPSSRRPSARRSTAPILGALGRAARALQIGRTPRQYITWVRQHHGNRPGKGWTQPPPPDFDDPPPADQPEPGPAPPRPQLRVVKGELPRVVDAAERLLIAADRELYEFGDQVVRPALGPLRIADNKTTVGLRLLPVHMHHMIERFTRCIEFVKYDGRKDEWLAVDCPDPVAKAYLVDKLIQMVPSAC